MSTIQEEITRITTDKANIKAAIESKGVTVGGDVSLDEYADKIEEIEAAPIYSDVDGMTYGYSTITEFPEGWKFAPRSGDKCAEMFYCCYSLTAIPQLDTSNVTNFGSMFYFCANIDTIPQLDTSNGTNFSDMFNSCEILYVIPQLDTSKGTSFSSMFNECIYLTSIPQLNVSNGTNFSFMFHRCGYLTTLGGLIGLSKDLSLSASRSLTHDSLMNVINNLATVTSTTTLTLGSTNLAKLTDAEKAIATNKGWTLA